MRNEFNKNVLTLLTGTSIAQAVPILISPILTRMYSPKDFGVLALFMAISAIFSSISSAKYELAIMLPKKDGDAFNIFFLGIFLSGLFSFILFIGILIFNTEISQFFDNKEISFWLYILPFFVLLFGFFNNLNYLHNRIKNYKVLSKASIIKSIIIALIQIPLGIFKFGASGLINGQIFSQLAADIFLYKEYLKKKKIFYRINLLKIIALAKKYRDFPKFSTFGVLANTMSQQLTRILISSFFSLSTLGYFSLVQRVLGFPSVLLGKSVGQVFFQEATQERQRTGNSANTFNDTTIKLFLVGMPVFGLLFFTVEDIFVFTFGSKWAIAGIYAKILLPLFLIRFIVSTISSINIVFEKQKIGLLINMILLISAITIIYSSKHFGLNFERFLSIFSIVLSAEYIIFWGYYFVLSRGKF